MEKQLTIMLLLLGSFYFTIAQTSISGKITCQETGGELISANVIFMQNQAAKAGSASDFNGNYSIKSEPGIYDVYITYFGYPEYLIKGVVVKPNLANKFDFAMKSCYQPDTLIVRKFEKIKIQALAKTTDCFVYSRIIDPLPNRTITLITAASSKCKFIDVDHENTMRWVWGKSYYLDGVRVDKNVSNISSFDIDNIQVFNGGVPAAYDDSCDSVFSLISN